MVEKQTILLSYRGRYYWIASGTVFFIVRTRRRTCFFSHLFVINVIKQRIIKIQSIFVMKPENNITYNYVYIIPSRLQKGLGFPDFWFSVKQTVSQSNMFLFFNFVFSFICALWCTTPSTNKFNGLCFSISTFSVFT